MFKITAAFLLYLLLWLYYSHVPPISSGKYFYQRFDYIDFDVPGYTGALPFLVIKNGIPVAGPGGKYVFKASDNKLIFPSPSGYEDGIYSITPFDASSRRRFFMPSSVFYLTARMPHQIMPVNGIIFADTDINTEEIYSIFKSTSGNAIFINGRRSGIENALSELRKRKPGEIIKHAVSGMLPKNKLRDQWLTRLYIYADNNHPYEKQTGK